MAGCRAWGDEQWQSTAAVTAAETRREERGWLLCKGGDSAAKRAEKARGPAGDWNSQPAWRHAAPCQPRSVQLSNLRCLPVQRSASMDATGSSSAGRPGEGDSRRCTRSSAEQQARGGGQGAGERQLGWWIAGIGSAVVRMSQRTDSRARPSSLLALPAARPASRCLFCCPPRLSLPNPPFHRPPASAHLRCRGRCRGRAPGARVPAPLRPAPPRCGAPAAPPGWSCSGENRRRRKREGVVGWRYKEGPWRTRPGHN